MKVLFARIGSMNFYDGISDLDANIEGAGSYNADTNDGHEQYNFRDVNGIIYGYCQSSIKNEIPAGVNLRRVDPSAATNAEYIDGVTVIFFSKSSPDGYQSIVGWYTNSRVYRDFQQPSDQHKRGDKGFNLKCDSNNARLLPAEQRVYSIAGQDYDKAGRPGQSNVFYVYDQRRQLKVDTWIQEAIEYVLSNGQVDRIEKDTLEAGGDDGQGFNQSAEQRKVIEDYSMRKAVEYFKSQDYEFIADRSKTCSFDLEFKRLGITYFVEVKGTQSNGDKVIVTRSEVEHARAHYDNSILYVLHSIQLDELTPSGGIAVIKSPWVVDDKDLKVITYHYTV
ncbi:MULTISPECIES: protein NO VEIN domain-containing protein [Shewanella]|uniref:DUF3883 domain-containing protein n=1 Tax=Shewanella marisflavi TaxID=260364 RepID=A0ABX5WNV0_9GAMM|nr:MULTISPECIES: DUF3883 domain-containing protein [Shewanella]QDF76228.1 DUF3883 domain-containing protein [Shewanella marisflavi]